MAVFEVAADAYDAFMGRYSTQLGAPMAALCGVGPGTAVLDVGAGSGALTEVLVARAGAEHVAAVEPSTELVAACAQRAPGADVRRGPAERLPWPDDTFEVAIAQLVVNFLADPVAGVREMARVVHPGGTVAASLWDSAGGMGFLAVFDHAVRAAGLTAGPVRSTGHGSPEGLGGLLAAGGLEDVATDPIDVEVEYADFDALWSTFGLGVGPAGAFHASLDAEDQARVRVAGRELLGDPAGPVRVRARAWAARGVVPQR